ncbi:MAG: ribonuclease H-like domain-containing protein [Treponema sp.]|nr:ribonuclease H-like domain-containing protein [Treponema sp.]
MPQNLRARLERIRETQKINNSPGTSVTQCGNSEKAPPLKASLSSRRHKDNSEWKETGCKTLSRTLTLPLTLPAVLPETLPRLFPDLGRNKPEGDLPEPNSFLFFDLETTGLSGGAGTVAFLAAFGRFVRKKNAQKRYDNLEITQFLLLDYPGENDFLENVLSAISSFNKPFFLTTYNGKAFDTPLLKTRCLMNGLAFPQVLQLDLLHPSRRLWKRIISGCSQANVEAQVLGLDRTGDTPGALAPDIWFSFLRSGEELESCRELLGICDHNVKDIFGLASLFGAFVEVAASPLDAAARFRCDEENLAMAFRRYATQEQTAMLLLEAAAKNYPRSCLRLGFDHLRQGRYEEGRAALKRLTEPAASWKVPCSITAQALALRSLAIDADRRLGQKELALSYIDGALMLNQSANISIASRIPCGLEADLRKRQIKLMAH